MDSSNDQPRHLHSCLHLCPRGTRNIIETQQEKGLLKAQELGLNPLLFNEGSASSSKDDLTNRPVLMDLLKQVEEGHIKNLFVWNTDRLSRSEETWSMIKVQLLKNKVKLFTSTGEYDLEDPMSKMPLSLMSSVAVYDNELRTQRFRDGKLKRVKEGGWQGGPPPFGYQIIDSKLEIEPTEAKWVRFIFDSWNQENSAEAIVSQLLAAGVKTRRGNAVWARGSIESLLRNTHYTGRYTYEDGRTGEKVECHCPPIIESDVWTKCHELIARRSNHTKKTIRTGKQKHTYLLLGLVQCGHCGSMMSGQRKTAQRSYYSCLKKKGSKYYHKHNEAFVECPSPRNLRMDLTDETVMETILHTIEESHLFKETIKQSVHRSEESHIERQQRIDKIMSKIKRNEGQVKKISDSLTEYLKDSVLEGIPAKDVKDFMLSVENKKQKILAENLSLQRDLQQSLDSKQWVGWFDNFQGMIHHLRSEETPIEEKHEFLKEVVDSITASNVSQTESQFDVVFKMPVFGDEFEWNDSEDKSLGYQLTEGSTRMSFQCQTQTLPGRKPSSKNN